MEGIGDVLRPHPAARPASERGARGPEGRHVGSDRRAGEGRLRRLEGQAEATRFGLETLEKDANTMEGGA